MDPAALASLLEKGGPWGIVAILCAVVAYLYTGKEKLQEERLKDTKEAIASIAAALKTVDTTIATLTHLPGKR